MNDPLSNNRIHPRDINPDQEHKKNDIHSDINLRWLWLIIIIILFAVISFYFYQYAMPKKETLSVPDINTDSINFEEEIASFETTQLTVPNLTEEERSEQINSLFGIE